MKAAAHIRPAAPSDLAALREIVNAIVAERGLTAIDHELIDEEVRDYFVSGPGVVACFVATSEPTGDVLGFQSIEWSERAAGIVEISTFLRHDHRRAGIGGRLFEHTRRAAVAAGCRAMDATVRSDNTGGLGFYTKLGFRAYRSSTFRHRFLGREVKRIHHRFALAPGVS